MPTPDVEYPREALRGAAREVRELVTRWTGSADASRGLTLALEKRRRGSVQHIEEARELLTDVLAYGLRMRIGSHLGLGAIDMANELVKLGAGRPLHVMVCDDCRLIFEPRRKSVAARCEVCSSHPRRDARTAAGVVLRRFDADGTFAGWEEHRLCFCVECGGAFSPSRGDATVCSPGCRTRRHRRRAKGDGADASHEAQMLGRLRILNRGLLTAEAAGDTAATERLARQIAAASAG